MPKESQHAPKSVSKLSAEELVAAFLYAEKKMTQEMIAEKMGISQSKASRLLKSAVEAYEVTRRFTAPGKPGFEKRRLEFETKKEEVLGETETLDVLLRYQTEVAGLNPTDHGLLRNVEVVYAPADGFGRYAGGTEADHYEYIRNFSRRAGELLSDRLASAQTFGVSWGAVLHYASETLFAGTQYSGVERRFYPACSTIRTGQTQFSSTGIARQLCQRLDASEHQSSLAVTAFIPLAFSKKKGTGGKLFDNEREKLAKHLLESIEEYVDTFGGYGGNRQPAKASQKFGTFLTGLSKFEHPYGQNFRDFMRAVHTDTNRDPLDEDAVRQLYVGDFSGDLMVKPDLDDNDLALAEELRELWTGIKIEDMQEIAKSAASKPAEGEGEARHGVVVLGAGSDRARVLLHALSLGLVSEIFIDEALHDALNKEAKSALKKKAG